LNKIEELVIMPSAEEQRQSIDRAAEILSSIDSAAESDVCDIYNDVKDFLPAIREILDNSLVRSIIGERYVEVILNLIRLVELLGQSTCSS
jgi:hypothetical protein